MRCPTCGANLEHDDRFCPECGSQVLNQAQISYDNFDALQIRCPKCNELNEPGTKYCCYCGYDFKKRYVTKELPEIKKKSPAKIILSVAGIMLVAVVGGVLVHSMLANKNTVEKADKKDTASATESPAVATTEAAATEQPSTETPVTEAPATEATATEAPATEATTQQAAPAVQMKFTDNATCDIDGNMTSKDFAHVESEDGSYSFSYPKKLFNNFSYSEEDGYYFSYEENGNTICSLRYYAIDDPGDPIDRGIATQNKLVGDVYDAGFVYPSNIREKGTGDDGYMNVIVLGWTDSSYNKARYVCAGSDGEKTYFMEFNYPDADKDNVTEKWDYIYTNTYRDCSFCGSSKKPYSTYEAFVAEN